MRNGHIRTHGQAPYSGVLAERTAIVSARRAVGPMQWPKCLNIGLDQRAGACWSMSIPGTFRSSPTAAGWRRLHVAAGLVESPNRTAWHSPGRSSTSTADHRACLLAIATSPPAATARPEPDSSEAIGILVPNTCWHSDVCLGRVPWTITPPRPRMINVDNPTSGRTMIGSTRSGS